MKKINNSDFNSQNNTSNIRQSDSTRNSNTYQTNSNIRRTDGYATANKTISRKINHRKRKSSFRRFIPILIILTIFISLLLLIYSIFNGAFSKNNSSNISSSIFNSITSNQSQSFAQSSISQVVSSPGEDTIVGRFFGGLYSSSNPKEIVHNEIRALYLGAAANLDKNIEIANNSAINAFVIDLKESTGIYYKSTNKLANEIGAVKALYNIESVIKKCKENDIKVIGRIVCFKDHILASKRPDLCIKDSQGKPILYPLEGNKTFVSAYNKEVWQYNIDIAKEAIALGVDEIQFDYIRFPTCNNTIRASEHFGDEGTVPTKIEAINRFLLTAKGYIQDDLGIPLSADIFGIVLTSKLDGKLIGQDWETVGKLGIDTLSPMIYPSHYAKNTIMGGIKFANPSADTYKFLNAVFKTEKYSQSPGFSNIRCYIQAYGYTQTQLFGQIKALKDNGFDEYIYWNSRGSYDLSDVMK